MFWFLVGLLLIAAIALLALPLLRKPASMESDQAVDALNVLRDQKRELDREVAAGRLTAEDRELRVAELTRRVVDEGLVHERSAPNALTPARRPWLALVLALAVPAIAVPLYLTIGTPAALDPAVRAAAPASAHTGHTPEQMRAMVAELKTRLDANPGDATGWTMLGRGLRMTGDVPGSLEAYERATRLQSNDAALLLEYAEVLALSRNRDLTGKPWELVQQALRINPDLPKGLAMAGAAEFGQGHHDEAKGYWQRLLAQLPPESPEAGELKSMLAQLGSDAGPAQPPQARPAQKPPAATAGGAVSGTVRIAPAFASQVAPEDTLFIYARAVEGPRMPLAVLRKKASDLPVSFRLDDSLAMAGGPALSSVPRIRVEARISKSGEAISKPGDLRGESAPIAPGAANLEVVIDQIVR